MIDKHQNASTQDQVSRVFFGVGCWDFGLRWNSSSRITINHYHAKLREGLESISSLNNLDIDWQLDDQANATVDLVNGTHTEDGVEIFSRDICWSITFDLYIPFRIQADLAGDHVQFQTRTENFKVYLRHTFYSPVAFVELLNADEPPGPSSAMVVIRKYLDRECRESSEDLVFSCLGPTPFHADFHIEARAAQHGAAAFEIRDVSSRAYSDITFFYSASLFDNTRSAFEQLMEELEDELGLYYKIQESNSIKYQHWLQIEKLMSRLTKHLERSGWRQIFWRTCTRGRDLEKLNIGLAEFEREQISDDYSITEAFRNIYTSGLSGFLRTYVEAEIEGRPVFPTKPTTDLLGFIEHRRQKALEFLVVLVAAIVGGVAGSLITIFVRQ